MLYASPPSNEPVRELLKDRWKSSRAAPSELPSRYAVVPAKGIPMNRLVKALLLTLLCPAALSAQAATLKDTLVDLERQSWKAWQARDSAFFRRFLSEDHVEIGVSGVANKANVIGFVGSPICVVTSWDVDNFALQRFDANTALLTYHAQQNTTCGGNPVPSPAWVASLYIKREGRWQNAAYQQSPAARQ